MEAMLYVVLTNASVTYLLHDGVGGHFITTLLLQHHTVLL